MRRHERGACFFDSGQEWPEYFGVCGVVKTQSLINGSRGL